MVFENDNDSQTRRTKFTRQDSTPMALGKLPPQAIDLEEAVLGAILLEKNALSDVSDILKPEIFYRDAHVKIYSAIQRLLQKTKPVDILTVTAELRQAGELEMIGGAYYITELTNRVASSANIEAHVRIIQQMYIKREVIRVSTDAIQNCYNDETDILELLTTNAFKKDELLGSLVVRKEKSNSELYYETVSELQKAKASENGITGVASGFHDLDRITAGWQNGNLYIVAARPAMGKTSLVLSFATNAAIMFQKSVAFFSLEMPMSQLMKKELSIETGVPLWKFMKAGLDAEDWSRIGEFENIINNAPIFWDDSPALHVFEWAAKCRRLKRLHDIELICIDYLQLMKAGSKNGNREQEISLISRTLKAVALELNVPVIALSQLSRKCEERPGGAKRPMLSDLRESGSIEQDADGVLFLYRDEYYKIEQDSAGRSTKGLAEVAIAKHRMGEIGDVVLKFVGETTAFKNDVDEFLTDFTQPIAAPNPFAGLLPSADFDKPNNFIIRPSQSNDEDDSIPF